MNIKDLARAVSDKTGLPRADATRAIEAAFGAISEAMKNGEEVRILGFGSFVVAERGAREGRNLHTGEVLEIKASKQARFKPGKGLKDALNS